MEEKLNDKLETKDVWIVQDYASAKALTYISIGVMFVYYFAILAYPHKTWATIFFSIYFAIPIVFLVLGVMAYFKNDKKKYKIYTIGFSVWSALVTIGTIIGLITGGDHYNQYSSYQYFCAVFLGIMIVILLCFTCYYAVRYYKKYEIYYQYASSTTYSKEDLKIIRLESYSKNLLYSSLGYIIYILFAIFSVKMETWQQVLYFIFTTIGISFGVVGIKGDYECDQSIYRIYVYGFSVWAILKAIANIFVLIHIGDLNASAMLLIFSVIFFVVCILQFIATAYYSFRFNQVFKKYHELCPKDRNNESVDTPDQQRVTTDSYQTP